MARISAQAESPGSFGVAKVSSSFLLVPLAACSVWLSCRRRVLPLVSLDFLAMGASLHTTVPHRACSQGHSPWRPLPTHPIILLIAIALDPHVRRHSACWAEQAAPPLLDSRSNRHCHTTNPMHALHSVRAFCRACVTVWILISTFPTLLWRTTQTPPASRARSSDTAASRSVCSRTNRKTIRRSTKCPSCALIGTAKSSSQRPRSAATICRLSVTSPIWRGSSSLNANRNSGQTTTTIDRWQQSQTQSRARIRDRKNIAGRLPSVMSVRIIPLGMESQRCHVILRWKNAIV